MKLPRPMLAGPSALVAGAALLAAAPPPGAPPAAGQPPAFVPLFNGRDLAGWTGDTAGYSVVDGAITCGPKGTNLFTVREYSNFVLRFRFRLAPGANNGIGVRAPLTGDAAYEGLEIQVLDDGHEKYAGWLKPWQRHGSVYGIAASSGSTAALKPAGEWNDETVTVRGSHVTVVVNGKTIIDADIAPFRDGAATPDGRPHPGLARTKGHVGFLGHGDEVHFRNIRIREFTN